MTAGDILPQELIQKVEEIGTADILVGIPSYNNERTIGQVIRAVQFGLAKYFPKHRAVIMNSDGGSQDRTRQIVRDTSIYTDLDTLLVEHPIRPARVFATPYHGVPGKGSAFRAVLETARHLKIKACAVVDSDLRSITPEWVELLLGPVLIKEYDYVAPNYQRHKYDGTITNSIVYPLTRALYGKRVRQPIGGDFGFSWKMVQLFLEKGEPVWGTNIARFGIDIWMTTIALTEGAKICQSFLGGKVHDAKDPCKFLEPMFKQVVGTLFYLTSKYEDNWTQVEGSSPTAMYGFQSEVPPEPVSVTLKPMLTKFRQGVRQYQDYWTALLPEETLAEIIKVVGLPDKLFTFPAKLWTRVVYDFAVAYSHQLHSNGDDCNNGLCLDLVASLVPLYFGRTASFVIETAEMPTYRAEEITERLCQEFEARKPYFRKRWQEPNTVQVGSKQSSGV